MYSRDSQDKLLELSNHWPTISAIGPRLSSKTIVHKSS